MKKIYILALAIGAISFSSYAQVEQNDDIESYDLGLISSQDDTWRTWSGDEGGAEDATVSSGQAFSGTKSVNINNVLAPAGVDQLYLIESQPEDGIYTMQWKMYIPTDNSGYYNLQGVIDEPQTTAGQFSGNAYFNRDNAAPGQGTIDGATPAFTFTFPHDAWFDVANIVDLDNKTYSVKIDGNVAVPVGTPMTTLTQDYFGGVDFYATDATTGYFIDNLVAGIGDLTLATNDFSADVFSVYPNPVKDNLYINSKAAVNNVTVYDVLGKVVLSANPDAVSPKVDMSGLSSGAYLVKVTIGNSTKTVKVLK